MTYTDEQIAEIAHEANRALQRILGDPGIPVAPTWSQFPEDQQAGVVAGVKIARHGAPPNVLHDSWMRDKFAAGWTYGETKDVEAKTHPSLVPFDSLSPADQAKDFLFSGVCVAMNAAAGVTTRHANDQLSLQEAEQLVRSGGGNQAIGPGSAPFGGLPPVLVQAPQPPERATEE